MNLLHLPSKTSTWTRKSSLETSGLFHCLCKEKRKKDYPSCYLFDSSLILMSCRSVSPTQRTGRDCLCCCTFTKTSFCLVRSALDRMKGFREKACYKCIWKGIDVLAIITEYFVSISFLSSGELLAAIRYLFKQIDHGSTLVPDSTLLTKTYIGLGIFYKCSNIQSCSVFWGGT